MSALPQDWSRVASELRDRRDREAQRIAESHPPSQREPAPPPLSSANMPLAWDVTRIAPALPASRPLAPTVKARVRSPARRAVWSAIFDVGLVAALTALAIGGAPIAAPRTAPAASPPPAAIDPPRPPVVDPPPATHEPAAMETPAASASTSAAKPPPRRKLKPH